MMLDHFRAHALAVVRDAHQQAAAVRPGAGDVHLAAVGHRIQGIAHDVEEDLLQLAAVGHDVRQAFGEVRADVHAAVLGTAFQKAHGLGQHFGHAQFLAVGLHAPGKAQQTVGDAAGAFHGALDGLQQVDEPVLALEVAAHVQQVEAKARLLVDDGQGVVDLMGHPGRQPADGGELLVVLHLGEDRHAAFVAGLQASHQMLHQQVRDQHDDGDAAAEDQQQFAAQGRPGFVDVQGGLDRQEHEVRARQAGISHHEVLSAVILPGPHRGLEGLGRQGQGSLSSTLP